VDDSLGVGMVQRGRDLLEDRQRLGVVEPAAAHAVGE
jgi:hypothetical protein